MKLDGTGQNVASNKGYGMQIEVVNSDATKTQAIYREKIAVNLNNSLSGTTVNYGDVAKVANEVTNTDAGTKLKTVNPDRVLNWTTNGNTFSLHSNALLDTIQVGTAADISRAGKLKANNTAYTTTSSTYTLSGAPTLKVDQKPITVSGITASDKVYDANTTAVVNKANASGWIAGDDVSVVSVTGTFDNKEVGNNKTVTLSNTQYGGADARNYSFTNQATTRANITNAPPKPPTPVVTPTNNGSSRVKVPTDSATPFQLASAEDLANDICSANSLDNCHCEESSVSQGVDICYEPKTTGSGAAR